jgi:glycosyltransferase involved in cell wall biosynthesis
MEKEFPQEIESAGCMLSVIIPARNEAESIGDCLASLAQQNEDDFLLGRDWELVVVDDGSTDATRQIVQEFAGVIVLEAPPLPDGWTGKANALWFAAQRARGHWMLFTDADTVHEQGNLRRAIHEAERHKVAMLSYSPRQRVQGFWQRATMPLIFADLAQRYPPRLVNQADSPVAAANGQFLLIGAGMYRRIGGHAAVHGSLTEDMDLARLCKKTHGGLRFRYAPDAVSARMYRSFSQMRQGWSKNLALLFPDALKRSLLKFFQAALLFGLPVLAVYLYLIVANAGLIWAVALWWVWRAGIHYTSVAKAHFSWQDTLITPLALPVFGWLLIESRLRKSMGRPAIWKGREYPI